MLLFSFLQDVSTIPNFTDWLQGIGTIIGVPGAIAAFILLFKKDKEKERQIAMLTNIVIALNNQTKQFEYQTSLMRESNEILKEQVQLQNEVLLDDKDYKERMKEIEIKKMKAQYKPYFRFHFGSSSANQMNVQLINLGERAKLLNYLIPEEEKLIITTPKNTTIEKNGFLELTGNFLGNDNLHKIDKMVEIEYVDSMGTKYKQNLVIRGSQVRVLEPVEVTE